MLVELAAVTGARYGQLAGLRVCDFQDHTQTPRLMMPSARKGRGKKKVVHQTGADPHSLAQRFRSARKDMRTRRSWLNPTAICGASLTTHVCLPVRFSLRGSMRWRSAHTGFGVTLYALRHTNIARQILHGTPIRVVAVIHDTSVAMIEKNYSALLADHAERWLGQRCSISKSRSSLSYSGLYRPRKLPSHW